MLGSDATTDNSLTSTLKPYQRATGHRRQVPEFWSQQIRVWQSQMCLSQSCQAKRPMFTADHSTSREKEGMNGNSK